MPTYDVWEHHQLGVLGGRQRGLSLEAEDIKACADQVRRRRSFIRRGEKRFLIVERGYHVPPGGGPLNFHGAEYIASDKIKNSPLVKRSENNESNDFYYLPIVHKQAKTHELDKKRLHSLNRAKITK